MNIITIQSYSENLLPGESVRIHCPECNGTDDTLSISRLEDGTVLYNCYRASCGYRGRSGSTPYKGTERPAKPPKKVWEGIPQPLPEPVVQWISERWGIDSPEHWYYTPEHGGRIAMSVRSPRGLHRGWVLRNDGSRTPKALTYIDEDEEGLSWYLTQPYAPTLLVEDMPSAIRASRYTNAVALLGTGIGESRAHEIAEYAVRPVYVALDQDATSLSFKWARKYSLLWGDVKVLPLKQDLKDMQESELCTLIGGLNSSKEQQ